MTSQSSGDIPFPAILIDARRQNPAVMSDSDREQVDSDIASLSSDTNDEQSDVDEKLAQVVFAATNRRDLDKRRLREARTVAPVPTHHASQSAPVDEPISQKDMMQRMLSTLSKASDGDKGLAIAQLEKKVARLHRDGKKQLSVPLPQPVQGRIERSVAYEKAKETLSEKWADVVHKNRKAERLVFPLNGSTAPIGRNSSDIAANFQPNNEYEQEIQKLLVDARVASEKQLLNGEEKAIDDLGVSEVSKEQLMERRHQLAKMRSLMFYYERKMKRIKKIKSKKYRRLLKKEREKVAVLVGTDDEQQALIKAERKRAEERATLRHKNTSKWVRRKLSRAETKHEGDTKAAIEEQLRLHQELVKKQGLVEDSDDSDMDSDVGESEAEEQLKAIEKELVEYSAKPKQPKGLMGMRFMQAAQERQKKQALELLKEMKDSEQSDDDGEGKVVFKGRRYFNMEKEKENKASTMHVTEHEDREAPGLVEGDDGEDDVEKLSEGIRRVSEENAHNLAVAERNVNRKTDEKKIEKPAELRSKISVDVPKVLVANRTEDGVETENNPWLSGKPTVSIEKGDGTDPSSTEGVKKSTKKQKEAQNAKSVITSESNPWLQGVKPNESVEKEGGVDFSGTRGVKKNMKKKDAHSAKVSEKSSVEVEDNPWLAGSTTSKKAKRKRKREAELMAANTTATIEDDVDTVMRMRQVAEAFADAGGAEEADFEQAKRDEVSADMPDAKEVQAEVLPGWGSWGGANVKRRKTESAFARAARERLAEARRRAVGARKDKGMKHVILEQRRVRGAAALTMARVPFPFAGREEWEMEVRTPVCRELMGGGRFSKVVRPRIGKRAGDVIEPMGAGVGAVLKRRSERAGERERARKGLMR
eukprot:TRINITY_DN1424_c0_g1_i1.p1 TRINITY_DN1424_c0_g1~~TRINITY_DN1424_c0_g1_i1.p1  ORF type:complete len:875 (+),score=203.66 TRINITY_DN1424_c0_g1_i1:3821-6445(+)